MFARRLEAICGVLAGILGLAGLGVGLFAPLATQCTSTTGGQSGCTMVSLAQVQGLGSLILPIEIFGLLSLAIALFALWHSYTANGLGLVLLWVTALLFVFNSFLALLSIGLFLAPADILALVAAMAGLVRMSEGRQAHA
jgi:hypothetical protein